jgi:methylamine dehydrogenase accessory protein MauD
MTGFELFSIIALWIGFLTLTVLVLTLYRQFGLLFMRPSEQFGDLGIDVGALAPIATVHDGVHKRDIRLDWQRDPDVLAWLVIFGLPDCPVCGELLADLEPLAEEWSGVSILYVNRGAPETTDEEKAHDRSWQYAYSSDGSAHEAFGVEVAPFAFVIDQSALVRAKGLVNSRSDANQLLRQLPDSDGKHSMEVETATAAIGSAKGRRDDV